MWKNRCNKGPFFGALKDLCTQCYEAEIEKKQLEDYTRLIVAFTRIHTKLAGHAFMTTEHLEHTTGEPLATFN